MHSLAGIAGCVVAVELMAVEAGLLVAVEAAAELWLAGGG